jgi:N-acyl-D-amino-acid deacylase
LSKKGFDLLIKGGSILDGEGSGPFISDIGILGDKIAFIGKAGSSGAEKVIDASGLTIAPGFIDTHSHSEFTLLSDPRAEGKVYQGITTEINGNCGLSAAPLLGEAARQREADLRELGIKERWSSFGEYFGLLEEGGLCMNFATLAGHGNLRASVMGYEDRTPSFDETERMKSLLKDAVNQGAIGLSTGLIYPPGAYSTTDELAELSGVCRDKIYTSHMRSEGARLIESINETLSIGKKSGIKVHISHIKTAGKDNWHKVDDALSLIDGARDEGMAVTCDRYPYTAASTDLDTILPSWTYEGGAGEELRRLSDEGMRAKIKKEILSVHPDAGYWQMVAVSSVVSEENGWMEGKTLRFISEKLGKEPVETLFHILTGEKLRAGAIFYSMNEENLRKILMQPYTMIGSDSSARSKDGTTCKGKPHPRGFGSFQRFLARYVRDEGLMEMPEAIHKITMLPCETFGIKGRGRIKEGFFADIAVFDPGALKDRATYDEPFLRPEGVVHSIVNGAPLVSHGSQTGLRPGRVLRHGK